MADSGHVEIGCHEEAVSLVEVSACDEAKSLEVHDDIHMIPHMDWNEVEEMSCGGLNTGITSVEEGQSEAHEIDHDKCVVCGKIEAECLSVISRGLSTFIDHCSHAGRLDIVEHVNQHSDAQHKVHGSCRRRLAYLARVADVSDAGVSSKIPRLTRSMTSAFFSEKCASCVGRYVKVRIRGRCSQGMSLIRD